MQLFPGHTFCKFPVQDELPILMMPGVLYIVGSGEALTAISEAEISSLQRVIGCGLHCVPWPFIEAGQSVSIERGPLAGVIGTIVTKRSRSRLILSVALLQRSVAVEIDADSIEQVLPSHETRLRPIQSA